MGHRLSGKTERATVRAFSKLLNAIVQVRSGAATEVIDTAVEQASAAVTALDVLHTRQRNERAARLAETGFDINEVEEAD
jgi:hypothetical protein